MKEKINSPSLGTIVRNSAINIGKGLKGFLGIIIIFSVSFMVLNFFLNKFGIEIIGHKSNLPNNLYYLYSSFSYFMWIFTFLFLWWLLGPFFFGVERMNIKIILYQMIFITIFIIIFFRDAYRLSAKNSQIIDAFYALLPFTLLAGFLLYSYIKKIKSSIYYVCGVLFFIALFGLYFIFPITSFEDLSGPFLFP